MYISALIINVNETENFVCKQGIAKVMTLELDRKSKV